MIVPQGLNNYSSEKRKSHFSLCLHIFWTLCSILTVVPIALNLETLYPKCFLGVEVKCLEDSVFRNVTKKLFKNKFFLCFLTFQTLCTYILIANMLVDKYYQILPSRKQVNGKYKFKKLAPKLLWTGRQNVLKSIQIYIKLSFIRLA